MKHLDAVIKIYSYGTVFAIAIKHALSGVNCYDYRNLLKGGRKSRERQAFA
jgi:hypothetical protein